MDEPTNRTTKIESLLQLYDIDAELEQQYQLIIKKIDAVSVEFLVLCKHWEDKLNGKDI